MHSTHLILISSGGGGDYAHLLPADILTNRHGENKTRFSIICEQFSKTEVTHTIVAMIAARPVCTTYDSAKSDPYGRFSTSHV
jgi:hypothetical protein